MKAGVLAAWRPALEVTSLRGASVKTGTRRVRARLCPVLGKESGKASHLK